MSIVHSNICYFQTLKIQIQQQSNKNVDGHFFQINALCIRTLKQELQLTTHKSTGRRRAFHKQINQCWEPSDELRSNYRNMHFSFQLVNTTMAMNWAYIQPKRWTLSNNQKPCIIYAHFVPAVRQWCINWQPNKRHRCIKIPLCGVEIRQQILKYQRWYLQDADQGCQGTSWPISEV